MDQVLLNLHTTTVITEVERQVPISPDILLSHCIRLSFNLHFVGVVVAPGSTVASTNRALTNVDVFG